MKDGSLHLKENHPYHHQVQGQLHITGKNFCDLVVWTPVDMAVVRIARSRLWSHNIAKLVEFYFNDFIPALE